ncbi:MAG: MBL fold metallo-hydrolase [Longimicrobiales bacterium]
MTQRPAHHGADGRFRNPWPGEDAGKRSLMDVLRWRASRARDGVPPTPPEAAFPVGTPDITDTISAGERARITWVGHSTFLIQVAGRNVLTDPVWSERASPFASMGPRRMTPPAVLFDDLPPIHTVLLSHDHYDHLDESTVRRLHARFGEAVEWVTPLGYRDWFGRRGITRVTELDWWQSRTEGQGPASMKVTAFPARHWTQRGWNDVRRRLWCSFAIEAADGTRIYFGGDSGYAAFYREIGAREPGFDVVILPVGAYDPRWFMAPAHMNPEDAVDAYRDLGGSGLFIPMHWGTFRLADDPPLEPPVRLRAAWRAAGLPDSQLMVPRHGDTVKLP